MVQWLGLGTFTAVAWVQSLVRELRPRRPHSLGQKKEILAMWDPWGAEDPCYPLWCSLPAAFPGWLPPHPHSRAYISVWLNNCEQGE